MITINSFSRTNRTAATAKNSDSSHNILVSHSDSYPWKLFLEVVVVIPIETPFALKNTSKPSCLGFRH